MKRKKNKQEKEGERDRRQKKSLWKNKNDIKTNQTA